MALTGPQRVSFRRYLGYTGDSDLYDGLLAGLSADTETVVVEILDRIAELRGQAGDLLTLERVEDTEFRKTDGLVSGEISRLIDELAQLTGVPIANKLYRGVISSGSTLRG